VPHTLTETFGLALSTMGNSDLVSGIGGLDAVKGASFDQAVIESKLWKSVRTFMRSYTISREMIALDVVKQVGHGNTFISHPHTAKHFRSELIFKDPSLARWEVNKSTSMVPEAKEIARKLLAEHRPPTIDKAIVSKGDEVIALFEKTAHRT
jgi:trimethylamine--corrinoid protein Co-methyltransferase